MFRCTCSPGVIRTLSSVHFQPTQIRSVCPTGSKHVVCPWRYVSRVLRLRQQSQPEVHFHIPCTHFTSFRTAIGSVSLLIDSPQISTGSATYFSCLWTSTQFFRNSTQRRILLLTDKVPRSHFTVNFQRAC